VKKNLLLIAFGAICGLLGSAIILLASQPPRGSVILLMPPPTPALWVIQISGAVTHPGVYQLPAGSRLRDAVQAAGGLTEDASLSTVNLAALLEDGKSIIVRVNTPTPMPSQPRPSITSQPAAQNESDPTNPAEPLPVSGGLININTATLEELDRLPAIGPVIAQRIIEYRTTQGPFMSVEDILNVEGIGQATFDKIKDLITVEP
jgi:competence protein ComEA